MQWRDSESQSRDGICLLVVDVQIGFINEYTRRIPAEVEKIQDDYSSVVATRFLNHEGSPHRRILEWNQMGEGDHSTNLAFRPRENCKVIEKQGYSAADDILVKWLRVRRVRRVDICGVDTDACVLATAFSLFDANVRPRILSKACASGAGSEAHEDALRIMRRQFGPDQIV